MLSSRTSGILMPISSLPSPYGIGTFGQEAYDFVDFLKNSGQTFWQILPLGTTSYGDSPYSSFSAFAGNHYFIDLDLLVKEGLLMDEEINPLDFGDDPTKVDYAKLFVNRLPLLRKAYKRGYEKYKIDLADFAKEHRNWLHDYALYMSIKTVFNLKSWQEWDEEFKHRDAQTLRRYEQENAEDLLFWKFTQLLFYRQWSSLKRYANEMGIKIIGDIPIYIAEDSADAWANSELFIFDQDNAPTVVSGCPPDAFSPTGQLWGNPIYDWERMDKNGYTWWIQRMRGSMELYDVIRIDHFRGFESYWEIPAADKTAEFGKWTKGPGMKLFKAIKDALGDIPIIAEDLGFLTQDVIDLLKDSGYPGMKVLQFAFDAREESEYLPHTYEKNTVCYTGTHDNDTVLGWFKTAKEEEVAYAIEYLKLDQEEGYHWGFIRGAWSSVSNIAIAPMQDFLGLDEKARINIPSTVGGNWIWRVDKDQLTADLSNKIMQITKIYRRVNQDVK